MAFGRTRETVEKVTDAVSVSKQTQQELAALRAQVLQLRLVLRAMWETVKPEGATDEALSQRVQDLLAQVKSAPKVAAKCPKCSRAVQENSELCIYCGAEISTARPLF